jgi:hypothetical protein
MKSENSNHLDDDREIHLAVCDAVLNFMPIKSLYRDLRKWRPDANPMLLRRGATESLEALATLNAIEFIVSENDKLHEISNIEALELLSNDNCWIPDGTHLVACKKIGTNYFESILSDLVQFAKRKNRA